MRRVPSQTRSVVRVQRMIDTFEQLVGQLGYESVTTTMVAERAEVSVGSLYQFFPDKRALASALASRYLDAFVVQVGAIFATHRFTSWLEAIDPIVDAYVEMQRQIPAFRHIRFGDPIAPELLDDTNINNDVISARMENAIEDMVGGFSPPAQGEPDFMDPQLALGLALEAGDAVLKFAFRLNPEGDPALVTIAKSVVRTVLESVPLPPVPDLGSVDG